MPAPGESGSAVFNCPDMPEGINSKTPSYHVSTGIGTVASGEAPIWPAYRLRDYVKPAGKVFMADALSGNRMGINIAGSAFSLATTDPGYGTLAARHNPKSVSMSFLDGRVMYFPTEQLPQVHSNTPAKYWMVKDQPSPPGF
jgi:hypothetical protein